MSGLVSLLAERSVRVSTRSFDPCDAQELNSRAASANTTSESRLNDIAMRSCKSRRSASGLDSIALQLLELLLVGTGEFLAVRLLEHRIGVAGQFLEEIDVAVPITA